MISRIGGVAFSGIAAKNVDVQVHISKGLPSFTIVGLADKAVSESKERLRAAFYALGLALPAERITVNLSPADLTKEGSHFDLPIALALLGAMNIVPKEEIMEYLALGEMALDGGITEVNGVLASSLLAATEKKGLIFPKKQLQEMFLVKNQIDLLPIDNLLEIISHFKGTQLINVKENEIKEVFLEANDFADIASVRGHESAKRALEITAAGKHNLLMIGPPGSGKSMLANVLGGISPPLTKEEALEVSLIYSIAGELRNKSFVFNRPYRVPHHSASIPALVGGGSKAKPGEITLAHHGILFLDEFAEFNKSILDALRQPLETGEVHISRVNSHVTYPANFQLIAAMNPCRCGYFGDEDKQCHKAPSCLQAYQSRISGPILDRIDIVIEVPQVDIKDLNPMRNKAESNININSSAMIKQKVIKAREIQAKRYEKYNIYTNSDASTEIIEETAQLIKEARLVLEEAVLKFKLSTRAYYRIIKVARTIADMESSREIKVNHISEAVSYRKMSYYHKRQF